MTRDPEVSTLPAYVVDDLEEQLAAAANALEWAIEWGAMLIAREQDALDSAIRVIESRDNELRMWADRAERASNDVAILAKQLDHVLGRAEAAEAKVAAFDAERAERLGTGPLRKRKPPNPADPDDACSVCGRMMCDHPWDGPDLVREIRMLGMEIHDAELAEAGGAAEG